MTKHNSHSHADYCDECVQRFRYSCLDMMMKGISGSQQEQSGRRSVLCCRLRRRSAVSPYWIPEPIRSGSNSPCTTHRGIPFHKIFSDYHKKLTEHIRTQTIFVHLVTINVLYCDILETLCRPHFIVVKREV